MQESVTVKIKNNAGERDSKNKEQSIVAIDVNLVFLKIVAKIQNKDILPVLGVGTLCFVGGCLALHYCGVAGFA